MTSVYFNNTNHFREQQLIDSLITEAINKYGVDTYYIPRKLNDKDDIFGEDPTTSYESHYIIDTYIKSYDNFEGDGSFLSKFNIEVRDQITITISRSAFEKDVTQFSSDIIRPGEGDLIFIKPLEKLFIIKYTNNDAIFRQFGKHQVWDCTCEVFEYSNERLRTGVPEVDQIEEKYSSNINEAYIQFDDGDILTDENGNRIIIENFDYDSQYSDIFADNDEISLESSEFLDLSDWTPTAPFDS